MINRISFDSIVIINIIILSVLLPSSIGRFLEKRIISSNQAAFVVKTARSHQVIKLSRLISITSALNCWLNQRARFHTLIREPVYDLS